MNEFKGFGATPEKPPTFNQAALLGIQELLKRSYHLAYEAGAVKKDSKGQQWFPLADVQEMASVPAWKEGRGIRDAAGDYHLPIDVMATLMGMPLEHFEHHLSEELGMQPTFPTEENNQ